MTMLFILRIFYRQDDSTEASPPPPPPPLSPPPLSDDKISPTTLRTLHAADETWYCREYWCGDSHDGHYLNGDGYHYFQMKGDGNVVKAYEYYETDEGEEHVTPLPDLEGLNWFKFFGFEDEEILERIPAYEFSHIEQLIKT